METPNVFLPRTLMLSGWILTVTFFGASSAIAQEDYQYRFDDILIAPASVDEPMIERFSAKKAIEYVDRGSAAWTGERGCVACHTNGTYSVVRPALSKHFGTPPAESREFLVKYLGELKAMERDEQLKSVRPAQAIFIAAGLAEWDAHVAKTLSPETDEALRFVFDLQQENGAWGTVDCWPPFESDAYHEATVAAMAVGTAPGYLANLTDETLKTAIERLKNYLRTETPPHDYGRACLLWASARVPDLLDDAKKQELIATLSGHQREDGGWSIRTFSAPEAWGNGRRAEKLRSEPAFENPPSDGHQTGLAIVVLREAGVPTDDPRIQRGVAWLLRNQRQSGRWWTRSLNTDKWHFITYSGSAYPLLALSLCDALPAEVAGGE